MCSFLGNPLLIEEKQLDKSTVNEIALKQIGTEVMRYVLAEARGRTLIYSDTIDSY